MNRRAIHLVFVLGSASLFAQFPPQIKNVVVIVQENRTPDNLFQFLTPACPIPPGATGLAACTPYPVTSSCYDVSPCGVSNQHGSLVSIPLQPAPLGTGHDPSHSHSAFLKMCDLDPNALLCRNDGAWNTSPKNSSYAYVANTPLTNFDGTPGHVLDPYLTLAAQYGWANYMFQSNQGPSFPAHQFIFSGTSALSAADDANSAFLAENPALDVITKQAGCLALEDGTNSVVSPALGAPAKGCTVNAARSVQECPILNKALVYPTNPVGTFCLSHESMADVLEPMSITWKYYAVAAGNIWTAPDAIQAICQPRWIHPKGDKKSGLECSGTEWNTHVDVHNFGTDILRDIANCNLANVVWATPNGPWSDHVAPYGPSWVAAIVNAIGNNPPCPAGTPGAGQTYWQDTAIVITWDDWGGWTDHEPPPSLGNLPCVSSNCPASYQFGFRVPLIVVSAYTPAGFIDDTQLDFGSILRMIEGINQAPEGALGFADQRATSDLQEFFTLTAPRPYVTIPAALDANFFLTYKGATVAPDSD